MSSEFLYFCMREKIKPTSIRDNAKIHYISGTNPHLTSQICRIGLDLYPFCKMVLEPILHPMKERLIMLPSPIVLDWGVLGKIQVHIN